jgi:hypothetical protein
MWAFPLNLKSQNSSNTLWKTILVVTSRVGNTDHFQIWH